MKFKVAQSVIMAFFIGLSSLPLMQSALAQQADVDFEAIIAKHWASQLQQSPIFATSLGVRDYDHLLPDPSLAAYDKSVIEAKKFLKQLKSIDASKLSEQNRLNYSLLTLDLENSVEAANYGDKYLIMNNRSGPHLRLTRLPDRLPFFKLADYQSYVKRLALMPEYLEASTKRIREGLENGWVQACAPMEGFEKSIEIHASAKLEDSVFMAPFSKRPDVITQAEFNSLKTRAEKLTENNVQPAFAKFKSFYENEYAPKCRDQVGIDVVDTGLHSKNWTRDQAIDYMAKNSGLSMNNITSEIDRYISWPGQALAYKTGELKMRELRAKAEAQLGTQFDVREFHDKVLENGALPLSVLEDVINGWLAKK